MRNQQLYYLIKALRRYNPNLLVLIAAFWTFRLIFQPNNFQHATLSFELVRLLTFVAHFCVQRIMKLLLHISTCNCVPELVITSTCESKNLKYGNLSVL